MADRVDFNRALLNLCGLQDMNVTSLTVTAKAGELPKVTAEIYITEHPDSEIIIKHFTFVEEKTDA